MCIQGLESMCSKFRNPISLVRKKELERTPDGWAKLKKIEKALQFSHLHPHARLLRTGEHARFAARCQKRFVALSLAKPNSFALAGRVARFLCRFSEGKYT